MSVGRRALRATLRQSSHEVEAPRARTTVTNGCSRTSSIERMSTCASGAAMGIARVATGRMRACTGSAPITGTSPSRNEKI